MADATVEYRLALDHTGGTLPGSWHLPTGVPERFPIPPRLTSADLADHRWYLEEYIRFPGIGDHAQARAFEQRLEAFGQDLFTALRHDGIDQLRDAQRGARQGGGASRARSPSRSPPPRST
ncbi:MAG: hypothetical protein ABI193_26670 [Minicystis sp.]